LVGYTGQEVFALLMNDAYKPRMHKVYAEVFTAVEAAFCLNVRKTPFPLECIFKEVSAPPLKAVGWLESLIVCSAENLTKRVG
jgi:hypothetical protein